MSDFTFDKVKGPDKDRWARGEGSVYEVYRDGEHLGRVELHRHASPAPHGSRIRSGASYLDWTAYPKGDHLTRLQGGYSRQAAAERLANWAANRAKREGGIG